MAATIEAPEKLVGKPIRRREDPKLMTGGGNFLDDIRLPGMSYAAVLRSPVAHAKIRGINTSRAKTMPGVIAVFTGEDLAEVNPLGELLSAWSDVINQGGTPTVEQLAVSAAWAFGLLISGFLFFVSREREFAVRL